jgi:hypothetical protein
MTALLRGFWFLHTINVGVCAFCFCLRKGCSVTLAAIWPVEGRGKRKDGLAHCGRVT